jgi:hypothetical protein
MAIRSAARDLEQSRVIGSNLSGRIRAITDQWSDMKTTVERRIRLATDYIEFHRDAQRVWTFGFRMIYRKDCLELRCESKLKPSAPA